MAIEIETAALDVKRLDHIVARSRAAADAFRRIGDQATVDRIVWALVVARLELLEAGWNGR